MESREKQGKGETENQERQGKQGEGKQRIREGRQSR